MSRCFPFPPPGFELKGRLDDVNLIIKEKEKSKKHKDKKEKKERSERKEKERGEDKHKEDKDKKEKKEKSERKDKERGEDKHKEDKKRKREKHKDKKDKKKDKQGSSGEKRSVESLENQNGQKLVLDSKPTDGVEEKRTVVELGNRIKSDGATSIQMVQKINIVEKEKANFLGRVQENGSGMLAVNGKRDRSFMANGQNLQVDSRNLGNGRNPFGENQIKVDEGKSRNGYKNIVGEGDGSKNEDQNKITKSEDKKRKKEKKKESTEFRKETVKQETSNGNFLDFHSNIPRDLLKEINDSQGKLPKLKELNGFLHAKDSGVRPNNMLRPAHQAAQTGSVVGPSQNTIDTGVGKRAIITDPKVNGKLSSPQSVIDNVRNTKTENGRVDHHNRMLSNDIISPHIIRIERKIEPCQTSNTVSMAKQIINSSANGKVPLVENGEKMAMQMPKESRMNGSLDGKEHSSSMPASVSLKRKEREEKKEEKKERKEKMEREGKKERKEKVAVTMKPPHPDLKYLSQILTVPEVELPQPDEQEWLFECRDSEKTRLKLGSPEIQPRKEVWSEAIHLEPADVTALPYVIPY